MLAFLLILLPLLVLAWQAWQSLNALSDQAALVNRTTLIDARRSEAMTNAALEMERSYRQYCVLDDPTLAKVYQSQRKRYSEMLDAHAGVLPDDKLYQALRQDLNNLAQLQCNNSGPDAAAAARLEAFASANTEMVQATRTVVFSRGQQLQREIAERGQYFGWQSLVLFLVSLVMVLLFHEDDYRSGEKYRAHDQPAGGKGVLWAIAFRSVDRASYARLGNVFFG
ncbi:sensor-like histidine kinase YfhK [Escherichia coli]|nr:sensor-like histidine kinase YfhK [Escherichia coli]